MNTRKTLLAAAASGALLLPVVLAAPAYANPGGGCSDENAGAAGQTLPKCGSNLLHASAAIPANCAQLGVVNVRIGDPRYRPELDRDHDGIACESGTGTSGGLARVNVNVGGTCGDDTLLLIQIRANEGGTHKTLVDAHNADRTAQGELATAKANDLAAEQGVNAAQARVNKDANAEALDAASDKTAPDGPDEATKPDAEDAAVDAANADKTDAANALKAANDTEAQRDNELEAAQHRADGTRTALNKAEAADHVLVVRINALVDRINHECGTPTPVPPTTTTPPPVALPTPTDTPPPAAIVPPSGSNNTQVIVQGPAPQIVQGPSQIGQAPQGFVSAGGGADAAIVSAQS